MRGWECGRSDSAKVDSGEKIRYLITDCPLGKVLVAATERGLCAVTLGDDVAGGWTRVVRALPCCRDRVGKHRGRAAGRNSACRDLAHDGASGSTGSAARFAGDSVRTAGVAAAAVDSARRDAERLAVAAELGQPRAVRAVARACARNPVALVVPCHRVVGKNGQLTGYRWGRQRKEKLLKLEHAANED